MISYTKYQKLRKLVFTANFLYQTKIDTHMNHNIKRVTHEVCGFFELANN